MNHKKIEQQFIRILEYTKYHQNEKQEILQLIARNCNKGKFPHYPHTTITEIRNLCKNKKLDKPMPLPNLET
jgi:UDP-galactopyranose mutase